MYENLGAAQLSSKAEQPVRLFYEKNPTKTKQKTNPSNKSTESGGKAEEVASDNGHLHAKGLELQKLLEKKGNTEKGTCLGGSLPGAAQAAPFEAPGQVPPQR